MTRTKRYFVATTVFGLAAFVGLGQPAMAWADRFDTQIKQLQSENDQSVAAKQNLATQALDLSSQVATLQAETSALQAQISDSNAKKVGVEKQITDTQAKLDQQKVQLAAVLRQMYTDDGMTQIEMLATSNDLSDYVNKEEYRVNVQASLVQTTTQIKALQKELNEKKTSIVRLLADQTAMNAAVSAKRQESSRLLGLNQQQQGQYNAAVSANNGKISELKRQQTIENARYNVGKVQKGGTGSYPWAGVAYPSSSPDPWGMYKRECVSYTAWKVASTGRYMPYWGGKGNAKLWDDNARAAGIPVDSNPKVGDVAISNAGTYGHAMYVEAVHDDGTITVSQYNASWDGDYSVAKRAVTGLSFIHF